MICDHCKLPTKGFGRLCQATVKNIPYGNGTLGQIMAIGDSLPNDHGLKTVDLNARCHTGPTRTPTDQDRQRSASTRKYH